MIIALDGPSASGKGTLSRLLSKNLGYDRLDTGLLYRAVAFIANKNNIIDEDKIAEIAMNLSMQELENNDLRLDSTAQLASKVAKITKVRLALLDYQRNFANNPPHGKGAILDGRDIGTVICPKAEVKFYITASLEERAKRRHKEMLENHSSSLSLEQVTKDLEERDKRDTNREDSPLKPAKDSYILNTDNKTPEQVLSEALDYISKLNIS